MNTASHLPDDTTKAILFDCDGTLVDTMPIHRAVWHELFLRYDFVITDDWWEEWANVTNDAATNASDSEQSAMTTASTASASTATTTLSPSHSST